MSINDKGRAYGAPATIVRQPSSYRPIRGAVNQKFPGRRDRAPARPARPADGMAAGMLLLLLSLGANTLPPARARAAWEIAEKWAAEFVEARHVEAQS